MMGRIVEMFQMNWEGSGSGSGPHAVLLQLVDSLRHGRPNFVLLHKQKAHCELSTNLSSSSCSPAPPKH